jgi:hypothetical protein
LCRNWYIFSVSSYVALIRFIFVLSK